MGNSRGGGGGKVGIYYSCKRQGSKDCSLNLRHALRREDRATRREKVTLIRHIGRHRFDWRNVSPSVITTTTPSNFFFFYIGIMEPNLCHMKCHFWSSIVISCSYTCFKCPYPFLSVFGLVREATTHF